MYSCFNINGFQCAVASKKEFQKKCRRVSIKNIPLGVSAQDISDLLKPYFYQQIHVDRNSQSCKAILLDGVFAERCINELHGRSYRGQVLCVSVASCDFMLCITQLPFSITHSQFLTLITPFGTSERSFLVYSELTGQNKGYGCVEFTSKESSIKAKNQLNGHIINGNSLQVHWLDAIPSTYSGLASRCLMVENLPSGFNDVALLKKVFSCFAIPKFCQIADCKNGQFGIIEYSDPIVCEISWQSVNGYNIGTCFLKVSFCVPGPSGLVIFNSLKASRDLKLAFSNGGLLPTPGHAMELAQMHQNKAPKDLGRISINSLKKLTTIHGNHLSLTYDALLNLKSYEEKVVEEHGKSSLNCNSRLVSCQQISNPVLTQEDFQQSDGADSGFGGSQASISDFSPKDVSNSGSLGSINLVVGSRNFAKSLGAFTSPSCPHRNPILSTNKLYCEQGGSITNHGPHFDSPTQLRLLGHNLMEGLAGDGLATFNCQLIDALDLLQPSRLSSSPIRCKNHFLPSPEPSPEAGAYVGQHSQGLGGHYADSPRRLHSISSRSPFSPLLLRRRKSNEI